MCPGPGSGRTRRKPTRCVLLVQELFATRRDLRLSKGIKNEMRYLQPSRAELEVLCTLLAELYERDGVLLTIDLPFSKWEEFFKGR